ncbi:WhiB family transcriptional regulator [Streptomyces sp. 1222.5]|uniref:WhiB family transcriptional regulator n=1 Tax=Streptomyces sp. 1222.5 TaxID=1881026 RepID=UPI003D724B6A
MTCTPSEDPAGSDWRDQAACVGEDPEIFFPLSDLVAPHAEASLARTICRRCPVIIACRTWALDHGEDDGIWGATTAAQRRAIRRATAEFTAASGRHSDETGEPSELAVRRHAVPRPRLLGRAARPATPVRGRALVRRRSYYDAGRRRQGRR